MDAGIQTAAGQSITNPLPVGNLGLPTMPGTPPAWANIKILSNIQVRNLQAQIGYDASNWNYSAIGTYNQLGRYQFSTQILEAYGLLVAGSTAAYGTEAVNFSHCWRPVYINNGQNTYQNYFYNVTSLQGFLNNITAQDHLAYQRIVDLYLSAISANVIQSTDTADMVAGMIYVSWTLGVGSSPTSANPSGSGAWAWRYYNIGDGTNSYNSGRYAVTILSQ
jgi:hypothetical protein